MILHIHNDETDKLDLIVVAKDFVSRNSSRKSISGQFGMKISSFLWYVHNSEIRISVAILSTFIYIAVKPVSQEAPPN